MQEIKFRDMPGYHQLKSNLDHINLLQQEICRENLSAPMMLAKFADFSIKQFRAAVAAIWYEAPAARQFILRTATAINIDEPVRAALEALDLSRLTLPANEVSTLLDEHDNQPLDSRQSDYEWLNAEWLKRERITTAVALPLPINGSTGPLGAMLLFAGAPFDPETVLLLPLFAGMLANQISLNRPVVDLAANSAIDSTTDSVADHQLTSADSEPSQTQLRAVLDYISGGLLIVSPPELQIVEINRGALQLFGLPAEVKPVGRRLAEIAPQQWQSEIFARIAAVSAANNSFTIAEHEHHRAGRGIVYWRIEAQYLDGFGEAGRILIRVTDISEVVIARQRIEQIANEAQERVTELEAIISQMAEGIIVVDSIGRILSINPRGMELLAITTISNEVNEHARTYHLYRMDGELLMDNELPFIRAVKRGEVVKDFEIFVHPPQVDERVISVNAAPLFNTNGQIIGAVAAFHDISDRIRYLKVLEENNERLIEVDHLKTRFISTVSHELRTPLNAITGLVQLLQRDKSEPLSERQLDMVSRIALNSKQLMMLINDLLDYSRLASGKENVTLKRFSAQELIEKVWVGLLDTATAKGLDCRREVGEIGEIESDYTKSYQVLTNLLGNAIKYTQKGTIVLRAYLIDEHFWAVEVIDTGAGIPSEDVDSIFDEFRRSRNAEMGKVTGTGLGLPISRKMVELMGGKIEAESTLAQGSLFRVTWPREVSRYISPDLIAGHNQS